MGRKIMLAVAFVALVAAPAFAAVQNVKVGGDLKTTSVIRKNITGVPSNATTSTKSQNVVLSQLGLNVEADLTDNVSTSFRFLNERVWGDTSVTNGGSVVVDTAYVTLKEFLYAPLTVTIGRQPLVYGNALIVGDGDGTGAVAAVADITGGINFDAVKAVLDYDPLTIDIFAAKANEDINMAQNDDDDTDLYGINANLKVGGDMNVVLEGYLFAKMDRNSTSTAQVETEKVYVPGLRVSLNPYEGLNLQAEAAYQTGSTAANETLGAYAFQTMASFALPVLKDISPVLSASYTYLSGDKNGTGDNNSAWDSMYYDQNAGRIFYNVYSFSDLKLASVALEATPMEDVTAKLSLYSLQEAKGTSNERGNEVDLDVSYAYTEDVTLGVSAGMFNSKVLGQDDTATQLLSSVKVVF